MKKILVVEDDKKINGLICEFLKNEGYKVFNAFDGAEGYLKFNSDDFDLVILDIMMPKVDGYALCSLIRENSKVPIIFLTALGEVEDEVKAFELMGDDYITKPFSFPILVKRVEAIFRRSSKEEFLEEKLTFEKLVLNLNTYKTYIDNKEQDLTLKEFNILKMLIKFYPKVLSREMLMDEVWGYDYYGDMRVIDAHIKNIRKKIIYDYIRTVKGVGYVLKKEVE